MESWKGHNISTTNHTRWVALMNLSTVDWRVGYLPPNVVATNGSFNRSVDSIPPLLSNSSADSRIIIIKHAGDFIVKSSDMQTIAYTTALAFVLLVIFFHQCLFAPSTSLPIPPPVTARGSEHEGFITVSFFEEKLKEFYSSDKTEVEEREKDLAEHPIEWSDVEEVAGLLRQWYSLKIEIMEQRRNLEANAAARRDALERQSHALLNDIEARVTEWQEYIRGDQNRTLGLSDLERNQEQGEINRIVAAVKNAIANRDNPPPPPSPERLAPINETH